ncbi:MAG: PAS domain-containing protein [Gemmatimonadaceae bacterium]|nr:PAS domain-containing protein [Acetobacteraceae bacterium]
MAEQDGIKKALLAAIAHSTEPLVLSDPRQPDSPLIAINAAFEKISGYPRDEILGRNCRFLQGPDTDPVTRARIGQCVRAEEGCIEWIVNYHKSGKAFWNLLFIAPVFDAEGRMKYYLGNQLDITRGFPDWLGEVTFGRAHMSAEVQAQFIDALQGMLLTADVSGDAPARALETMIITARRIAELSTQLEPGAAPAGSPPLPIGFRPADPAQSAPAGPAAL